MKVKDVWFKFFPEDWFNKTRHMDLELRGAYHEAICLIMRYEEPLKDDMRWIGHMMHVSERKATAVIEKLIALGKLRRTERGITNDRCEREIAEKVAQRAAAAAAALARHRPEVGPGLGQDRPEVGNDKKAEQNQQNKDATALLRAGAIDSDSEVEKKDSPLPPIGGAEQTLLLGAELTPARRTKRPKASKKQVAERFKDLAVELRAIYNGAAEHFGFHRVQTWTEARDAKHVLRVIEIGGKDAYRRALYAIRLDPFLSGQKPARPGESPFVLDFEKLMQTTGNMGDVLARLLDLAARPQDIAPVSGKRWGWWRDEDVSAYTLDIWRGAVKSTGFQAATEWPWWIAGPPPGHKECFVPTEILSEFNLIAKFGEAKHA